MRPITISAVMFVCLFGGGLLGIRLRSLLPEGHLTDDSRHLLETGLGIIGTIGGLVLGLLVGSAFGSYNAQRSSLVQMSANIVLLDRVLAHYGPEANDARAQLKIASTRILNQLWPANGQASEADPAMTGGEVLYDKIESLVPKNDTQRSIKGEATGMAVSIGQTRWLMYMQLAAGISLPLLVMLTFWFTITFIGLGIFARSNPTVIIALFLAAAAVAGATLILQEMYQPFEGVMQIPSTPLRQAVENLGR